MTYYRKLFGLLTFGTVWYSSAKVDKQKMRENMFDRGYNLSQRYKQYKAWVRSSLSSNLRIVDS